MPRVKENVLDEEIHRSECHASEEATGDAEQRATRKRHLTTKGLEHTLSVKMKLFNAAVSKWRTIAGHAEELLSDEPSQGSLKDAQRNLKETLEEIKHLNHEMTPIMDNDEQVQVNCDKVDKIEGDNLDLLKRISTAMLELKSSTSESRQTYQSIESEAASLRLRAAETAANAAALRASLQYAEAEAQREAELNVIKLKKQLDMEDARSKALSDAVRSIDLTLPNVNTSDSNKDTNVNNQVVSSFKANAAELNIDKVNTHDVNKVNSVINNVLESERVHNASINSIVKVTRSSIDKVDTHDVNKVDSSINNV